MHADEPPTSPSVAHALPEVDADQPSNAESAPGRRVGRYVLESILATNGVGALYAATDAKLDRKVALRLIPSPRQTRAPYSRRRLLRETRSMARLSHPNVVRILDVGASAHEVFVAMELVDGGSLQDWIDRTTPTPAQILTAFLAAGRGLVAAHEAGFVHGNFDTRSVLRTPSGRIVVRDFGLSRARTTHDGRTDPGTDTRLVRDDQVAFCEALYEALFHEPAPAQTEALDDRPTVRGAEVPGHVVHALSRGLDRSRRFSSVAALLDALEGGTRRRTWATAALALTLLVVGAWAAYMWNPHRNDCESSTLPVDFSPSARDSLVQSIEGFEAPHAQHTASVVGRRLASWAHTRSEADAQACRAGASAPTPCARDQMERARDVVTALRDPTTSVRAISATMTLDDPDVCQTWRWMTPTERRADVALTVGRLDEALEMLTPHAERGRLGPLGWALHARALAELGFVEDAVASYRTALDLSAPDDIRLELARALMILQRTDEASTQLQMLQGHPLTTPDHAELLVLEAVVARARGRRAPALRALADAERRLTEGGDTDRLRAADIALMRGQYELERGRNDTAMEHFLRAHRVRARLLGPLHPDTAYVGTAVARAWLGRGHLITARDTLHTSISVLESSWPADHPALQTARGHLAWLRGMTGHLEAGIEELDATLAALSSNDSAIAAMHLAHRGALHFESGRHFAARVDLERALSIRMTHGETFEQARVLTWLAMLALEDGDPSAAERLARESLSLAAQRRPEDSAGRVPALLTYGRALARQDGRQDEARSQFERALSNAGSDVVAISAALVELGRLDVASGFTLRGRARLDRANALLSNLGYGVPTLLECHMVLSTLDWESGRRTHATSQMQEALALSRRFSPRSTPRIETWLASHVRAL